MEALFDVLGCNCEQCRMLFAMVILSVTSHSYHNSRHKFDATKLHKHPKEVKIPSLKTLSICKLLNRGYGEELKSTNINELFDGTFMCRICYTHKPLIYRRKYVELSASEKRIVEQKIKNYTKKISNPNLYKERKEFLISKLKQLEERMKETDPIMICKTCYPSQYSRIGLRRVIFKLDNFKSLTAPRVKILVDAIKKYPKDYQNIEKYYKEESSFRKKYFI